MVKLKLKRFSVPLLAFIFLIGCTAQQHLQKAHKHQIKAIEKGAVFIPEIDTVFTTDTLTTIERKNDTVFVTNTVIQIQREKGEVRYITRKDKKKERKIQKTQNRRRHQLEKIEARQGSRWEWWLIVLLIATFTLYLYLTRKK